MGKLFVLIAGLRRSGLEPALTLAKTLRDWSGEIARMWRFGRNMHQRGFPPPDEVNSTEGVWIQVVSQIAASASSPNAEGARFGHVQQRVGDNALHP